MKTLKQWLEMIGYHGAEKDFDAFDPKLIGIAKRTSISPLGFFFAPTPEEANVYADMAQRGGGLIQKWDIDLKNPYTMPNKEFDELINWGSLENQKYDTHEEAEEATRNRREDLEAQGYDGALIIDRQGKVGEIVAFHPYQMKKITTQPGINIWK